MSNPSENFTLQECKIQASILLKSLRSKELKKAQIAAKRLQQLPELATFSIEALQEKVQRKHALAVIAIEQGFKSWQELKTHCEVQSPDLFAKFFVGGFLNKWFANYAEAKAHQQITGGFLLPYKKQFYICEADYIKFIGFDPNDPDWQLIGWDWVKPLNQKAWQRLYTKWLKIQGGRHG